MELPFSLVRPSGGNCAPCSVSDEYAPSVHFEGDKDFGIPESGLITFRFKRESKNESERNGKTNHSVCLELREIVVVKGDKKAEPEEKSTGEVLDELLKDSEKE